MTEQQQAVVDLMQAGWSLVDSETGVLLLRDGREIPVRRKTFNRLAADGVIVRAGAIGWMLA